MDDTAAPAAGDERIESAFEFTGTWREFLPIALTNLLLTVVTLGIYRFWATARERQYLWSRTRFVDDHLEWTGTGKEMFLGFLIVFLAALPIVGLFVLAFMAVSRGGGAMAVLGGALIVGLYLFLFYIGGVARFRALRYRLSRSWWHGIRGGSEAGGWHYGWQYMWKTGAGFLVLGLLVPWSMTQLWNDRWNRMSFGGYRFEAFADTQGLMGRWLLIYAVPLVTIAVAVFLLPDRVGSSLSDDIARRYTLVMILLPLAMYMGLLLVSLSYYAAYYRKVVSTTTIADLEFRFTARTWDWLKLILGHIGLVIVTLGIGLIFIRYRNWSFAIRHMEALGEVDLSDLIQSAVRAPGEAEGLADAFDIGAI